MQGNIRNILETRIHTKKMFQRKKKQPHKNTFSSVIHVSYGLAFFASHTHTHTNLTTTVRKQRNKTKIPHTRTKHDRRHTQTHTPKHRYAITVTLILTIRFFKLHQNRHSCGRHSSQLTMYVEKPTYYGVVVFRYRKR